MGLTAQVGAFLADISPASVPAEAAGIVRGGFADCFAVLLAGWEEPACRIVRRTLDARGEEWRPLHRLSVPGPQHALIHALAAHVLDYDDTALGGHPSAVLVPSVLAEGLETGTADGRTLIAAYVAGYEVWAELARREHDPLHAKGWHPSAVYGALAAAAASSVLRGLDARQAAHAVGIAASMAGGIVANFGSMTKPFQLARAAQSGLIASRLAHSGLESSPDALEHDLGFLNAVSPGGRSDRDGESRLGCEWAILRQGVNIKLYPVCYAMHRSLDAMAFLLAQNPLRADEVSSVEVEIGETQAALLRNHRPRTALDAKFSAEFGMAAMALAGRCGPEQLSDSFVARDDVQQFLPRINVRAIARSGSDGGTHSPFDRVSVILADGRRIQSPPVAYALGHYRNPAPREALWRKFRECAVPALAEREAQSLFDRVAGLEHARSVQELLLH